MNDWKPFYFNNQILNFFCAVAKKQIEYNELQPCEGGDFNH